MAVNYLKKVKGGAWTAATVAPVFGKVSTTGDYYIDGTWYNSSGVAYTTPITYLPYTLETDAEGNVAALKEFDVPDIVVNSVNTKELTGLDKPVFYGTMPSNVTASSLIFPFTTVYTDTHNSMNGGVYTIPKTGYYSFGLKVYGIHGSTIGYVAVNILKNGSEAIGATGSYAVTYYISSAFTGVEYFEEGDTLHCEAGNLSGTGAYVHQSTYLTIEYIGDKFNAS